MKTSTLLRGLTVFIFILLIAAFVSYRSGAFSDDDIQPVITVVDTSGRDKVTAPDTLGITAVDGVIADSVAETTRSSLLPGSKSIIVAPEINPFKRTPGGSIKPKRDTVVLLPKKQ